MPKQETLTEVKRAEDDVRKAREEAQKEAARILKESRAKAEDVLAQADHEADTLHRREIERARASVQAEREAILREGQKAADALRNAATGARLEKASLSVVKRFQDRAKE